MFLEFFVYLCIIISAQKHVPFFIYIHAEAINVMKQKKHENKNIYHVNCLVCDGWQ